MRTWQRTTAGVAVALVGVVFIGSVIVNDLFSVGPAFERLSDGFRPVMQESTIAALEQDVAGLAAVTEEFQSAAVPLMSEALQATPEEFQALVQEQFADVATGMEQLPGIVESFTGVVATLAAERERFTSADAIPTTSLPATTVPWAMLVAGLLLIALGIAIVALPGRGVAIAAAVVGGLLIVVPLLLSLPSKASAADTMNENLEPVYTQELIEGANQALATVGAMGTQMQEAMLPALGQQLGMSEDELQAFLQENLPATGQALGSMPDALGRFTGVVEAFAQSLDDYRTLTSVAFVPIVWTMILGGAVALAGALWAIVARRSTAAAPLVESTGQPVRTPEPAA
jgi:hypothetical protein